MTFWILAGAMMALAVVLIAVPVARAQRTSSSDAARDDQVRRLEELETDVAAGDIDAAVSDELRRELERSLLDNVDRPGSGMAPGRRAGPLSVVAVCLLVPVIAALVYLETGSPRIAQFAASHPGLDLSSPAATVELLMAELRERVRTVPGDREAWTLLARTNMQLERYDEAAAAGETLVQLAPTDPDAKLLLIDALAMQQGGRIGGRAAALIDDILALDPDHTTAQVLKGIVAREAGDAAAALDWWQRALAGLAPDSPLRGDLERMVAHAGGAVPAERPGGAPGAGAGVRVTVDVTIDAAVADRARPDDTVFVIARAVGGPAVPLAVSRHVRADLPLTVTLDDSMGMVPGMSLTDFEKIYLVARVSRQGGARAASGDLEGRSAEIVPGTADPVAVTIDRILP